MRAGDWIENRVTGERFTWLETAAETGGASTRFRLDVKPGGFVSGEHVHPRSAESFTVRSGELTLRLSGAQSVLGPGMSSTAPAGVRHVWWNAADEPLSVEVEVRPAARTEEFLTTWAGLGQWGKMNEKGMPNLIWASVVTKEFSDSFSPAVPAFVLKAVIPLLAAIGRMLGYRVTDAAAHALNRQ